MHIHTLWLNISYDHEEAIAGSLQSLRSEAADLGWIRSKRGMKHDLQFKLQLSDNLPSIICMNAKWLQEDTIQRFRDDDEFRNTIYFMVVTSEESQRKSQYVQNHVSWTTMPLFSWSFLYSMMYFPAITVLGSINFWQKSTFEEAQPNEQERL